MATPHERLRPGVHAAYDAGELARLRALPASRAGIDPAVVSAPMISTPVDASGLFTCLSIAGLLLGGAV